MITKTKTKELNLITKDLNCNVVLMNPSLAEKILSLNKKNRNVSESNLSSTVHKMKNGKWHENGESIIIGSDGVLKDGQHRLEATIKSNHVWRAVLVTGVSPLVMSSIDTGKNRSASDVLAINGYTNAALKASVSKMILAGRYSDDSMSRMKIDNQDILHYVSLNDKYLNNLILSVFGSYTKQNVKIFNPTFLSFILHTISGNIDIEPIHISFIKSLCGLSVSEGSATYWLRSTIIRNKNKGASMPKRWIYNAVVKSWNLYKDGDLPVSYLKVSTQKLEKVELVDY